jgi:hypothetical protein
MIKEKLRLLNKHAKEFQKKKEKDEMKQTKKTIEELEEEG